MPTIVFEQTPQNETLIGYLSEGNEVALMTIFGKYLCLQPGTVIIHDLATDSVSGVTPGGNIVLSEPSGYPVGLTGLEAHQADFYKMVALAATNS